MPHETLCERPAAFAYGCLWVAARKQFTHTHSKSFEILGHGFLSQRQAHCHTAPAIFPGIFRGNPNGRMRKCILADHFHFPTEIPVQSLHYRGSSTDALHMLILHTKLCFSSLHFQIAAALHQTQRWSLIIVWALVCKKNREKVNWRLSSGERTYCQSRWNEIFFETLSLEILERNESFLVRAYAINQTVRHFHVKWL